MSNNKAVFSKNLQYYMDQAGMTRNDICAALGFRYSTFTDWVRGVKFPRIDKIEMLANYFGIEKSDLIEDKALRTQPPPSNIIPVPAMKQIPLVGTIACGSPILAAENIEGAVDLPEHIHADFALRCKGDSMINARIYDGDIVYIRQQPTVESGEIAAVLIDNEATLKRVRLFPDHIALEPENPQYRPLVYWESEMNDVHILGLAVAFTSAIR